MNNVSKNIKNALNQVNTSRRADYLVKCIKLFAQTRTYAEQKYVFVHIGNTGYFDPFEYVITMIIALKHLEKGFSMDEFNDIKSILEDITRAPKPIPMRRREEIFQNLRSLNISLEKYPMLMKTFMTKKLEMFLNSTNLFEVIKEVEYLDKNPDLSPKYYPVVRAHLKLLAGYPRDKNLMNEKIWSMFNNSQTSIKTLTSLAYSHLALLNPKYKEDWIEVIEYDAVLRKAGARIQNPVYLAIWKKIMWQLEQEDWEDYLQDLLNFTRLTLRDPQISPAIAKMATRAFLKLYETGYFQNKDLSELSPKYRENMMPTLTRKQRADGLNMARYSQELLKRAQIRVLCGTLNSSRKRKTMQNNQGCQPISFLYRAFQNKPSGDALEESALMYTYMNERGFRHVAGYGDKYQYLYRYEVIKPLPLLDLNRGVLCRPTYKEFLEKSGLVNMHGNYAGSDPQPIKAYQEYMYTKKGIMGHVAIAQLDCHRKKVVQRSTIISRSKSTRYQPNYSHGVGTITRGLETNQRTRNAIAKRNFKKEVYGNAEVVLYLPKKRREYLRLVGMAKINANGGLEPWMNVR